MELVVSQYQVAKVGQAFEMVILVKTSKRDLFLKTSSFKGF